MKYDLESFLKLFNDNPVFSSFGENFSGNIPPDINLFVLMGLQKDRLKPFTLEIQNYLETDNEKVAELKWGYRAYSEFQDILNLSLSGTDPLWNRHYCYYESLVYLRESIVCWLDQNLIAAMALIRPFLELSIFHLYWYLSCEPENYEKYYLWFNTKSDNKKYKPPFKNMLEKVLISISKNHNIPTKRLKGIGDVINNLYGATSSYNHTPKIDESIISQSGNEGKPSLYIFFYYLEIINIVIRQLVFLYILTYPTVLFPINRFKKWGLGGPMGILFDEKNFATLEKYIGHRNIIDMKTDFENSKEISPLIEWFNGQKDISIIELESSWKDFIKDKPYIKHIESWDKRLAVKKAYDRSLGWFMNYYHYDNDPTGKITDEMIDSINKMVKRWK
jgi:hypothetical protein